MKEIVDILGLPTNQVSAFHNRNDALITEASTVNTIDETELNLSNEEVENMATVAKAAVDILHQLQANSADFETKIRQLSQEMNALELQSSSLHHRLMAREEALKLLDPLLEEYAIPAKVVNTIYEGEMDMAWYAALDRVRQPINLAEKGHKYHKDSVQLRKVLLSKAVERLKTFYVSKLRVLRRPGVDAQAVQAELLQTGAGMDLLRINSPRLAASLGSAYRNTMKWYYTMLFGKYGRWLNRQPLATMGTVKLLGSASHQSGTNSMFSMAISSAKSIDSFSVGARPTVLLTDDKSAPPLPMTATLPTSAPYYPLEVLVRSILVALADSFEMEGQIADILDPSLPGNTTGNNRNNAPPKLNGDDDEVLSSTKKPASALPHSPASSVGSISAAASDSTVSLKHSFIEVFEPTLTFYTDVISQWISHSSGDLFGLLLTIRLVQRSPLQKWIKPWLEDIAGKCWPHILHICQEQAKSIEHSALKASTVSSGGNVSTAPHTLTQLVSSYLSGILQLSTQDPEPALAKALNSIVEAYELFISKLAAGNEKVLYNNYFVMSSLLGDIDGPLAQDLGKHFQLLVQVYNP